MRPTSFASLRPLPRSFGARFGLVLAACAALAACEDGGGFHINVGIGNSTGQAITVTITADETVTLSVGGGYASTEVEGTSGDVVSFSAAIDGTAVTVAGMCTATNAIVGTAEYGQINIIQFQPSGAYGWECSSGWLES